MLIPLGSDAVQAPLEGDAKQPLTLLDRLPRDNALAPALDED